FLIEIMNRNKNRTPGLDIWQFRVWCDIFQSKTNKKLKETSQLKSNEKILDNLNKINNPQTFSPVDV
ncbi:hypothetical protein SNEBB_010071, partial [Seison nebaliae]